MPSKPSYLDYVVTDNASPNDRLTVTANKIEVDEMNRVENVYAQLDRGVDYYDFSFNHKYKITQTADTNITAVSVPWGMWDSDVSAAVAQAGGDDMMFTWHRDRVAGSNELWAFERDNGTNYSDGWISMVVSTPYWVNAHRDLDVGTYGTLYHLIYSDAFSTLIDTLTVTLHTAIMKPRRQFAVSSWNSGHVGYKVSLDIENLDLQEATGAGIPIIMHHRRQMGIS